MFNEDQRSRALPFGAADRVQGNPLLAADARFASDRELLDSTEEKLLAIVKATRREKNAV